MTWGKVSDDLHSHPKWVGLSGPAGKLWVTALSYCSRYETDGRVVDGAPLDAIAAGTFGLRGNPVAKARRAAAELVAAGLWETIEGGWTFHDWRDYNPSRRQTSARRRRESRKTWLHKTPEGRRLKAQIRARDGTTCAYCGIACQVGANRSPRGLTYDHVDPDGPDEPLNIVVACNQCNGTKSDCVPEDVGLSMRPDHALFDDYVARFGHPERTQSRLSRDSIAIQSADPGSGRVGSGRDGASRVGSSLAGTGRGGRGARWDEPPPPTDDDAPPDEEGNR